MAFSKKHLSLSYLMVVLKKILITHRRSKKIANEYVKNYYLKNKAGNNKYVKNVWSKNEYWDFFLQSLPHSIKSQYYVPRDYYAIEIESKFRNNRFSDLAIEKNYYTNLFFNQNILMPKTMFRIIDGIVLSESFQPIDNLSKLTKEIKEDLIVKNTLGSEGTSVVKYFFNDNILVDSKNVPFDINSLLKKLGNNIIAQEVVNQHPFLAQFHPSSLNTVRAFTYRSVKTNKVHVVISMLRMGIGGSYIDNASVDGIAAGINLEDGTLKKYAFNKYGAYFDKHPDTGILFENQKIPFFDKIVQTVEQLANVLAHNRLIGWDISLSPDGEPILIEPNTGTGTWMLQIANGRPLFGPFSEEVFLYMRS